MAPLSNEELQAIIAEKLPGYEIVPPEEASSEDDAAAVAVAPGIKLDAFLAKHGIAEPVPSAGGGGGDDPPAPPLRTSHYVAVRPKNADPNDPAAEAKVIVVSDDGTIVGSQG
jgi:hypothetical protein